MSATTDHVELVDDLRRLTASRLIDPLNVLTQSDEITARLRDRVRNDADMWAAQLLGPNDDVARSMAVRLIAALFPGDTPFDPPETWWRTPLGKVVARRLGHPSRHHVPFSVAAAMLGITRQGVHDLANRGKLHRHLDGGVTTASIQERLARLATDVAPTERTS